MWWSNSGWELNTDTGWPSAAQTLLKFTPAAITRTVTSKAPGLRRLDLLELEGVERLALALLADDPRGHRGRQLARLGVDLGDLAGVNGHLGSHASSRLTGESMGVAGCYRRRLRTSRGA